MTDTAFYNDLIKRVTPHIRQYGQVVEHKHFPQGEYDDSTGEVTGNDPQIQNISAAPFYAKDVFANDSEVKTGDLYLIVEAQDVQYPVVQGDRFIIGGVDYACYRARPTNPGGITVIFEAFVRA